MCKCCLATKKMLPTVFVQLLICLHKQLVGHVMLKVCNNNEKFEKKLILLKFPEKISFRVNITSTIKKTCKLVSCLEVIGENCAYKCYLL